MYIYRMPLYRTLGHNSSVPIVLHVQPYKSSKAHYRKYFHNFTEHGIKRLIKTYEECFQEPYQNLQSIRKKTLTKLPEHV
jgi:hypothetical protein